MVGHFLRLHVTCYSCYLHVIHQQFVTLHVFWGGCSSLHVIHQLFITLHVICLAVHHVTCYFWAVRCYMLFICCSSRYMFFLGCSSLHVILGLFIILQVNSLAVHHCCKFFFLFLAVHYLYCLFLGCYRLFCDCCYSFWGSSLDLVQVVFQFVTFHCFEFSVFYSDYKFTLDFLFLWRITVRASPFCKVNYLAVQCSSLFLINKD